MMAALLKRLCVLSVFCGAARQLAPEGSARKGLELACSVALLACALSGFRELDLTQFTLETARYHEREQEFLTQSEQTRDALYRRVIEAEYAAYIEDRAAQLGLTLTVSVTAQWSLEGLWLPYTVTLTGEAEEQARASLARAIEAELGIKCRVIATGGLAKSIAPHCKSGITCDDDLLLKGLWALYARNQK